jgi:hypothetical protein
MSDDPVCDHCGVGGPTFTAPDPARALLLAMREALIAKEEG